MAEFILDKVPGKIRTKSQLLGQGVVAQGGSGKPKRMTEVQVILELDPSNCMRQVESLFPGAANYLKLVSADENFKGEDRNARTKLPEMQVEIFYGEGAEPVLLLPFATVKARAQLRVGVAEKAEARFIVKPRGKFDEDALVQLVQLMEADIRVSMRPAQTDIGDFEFISQEGDGAKKDKKEKKPKEPKEPKAKGDKTKKLGLVYSAEKGLSNPDDKAASH